MTHRFLFVHFLWSIVARSAGNEKSMQASVTIGDLRCKLLDTMSFFGIL